MLGNIQRTLTIFIQDEEGAQILEAVLLTCLIALLAVAGMSFLGRTTTNKMDGIGSRV